MNDASTTPTLALNCHLCGSNRLIIATAYESMARVTSDCKPWKASGLLAECEDCHLVQTVTTPSWHEEAAQIYAQYTIYHQSGGVEQSVFGKDSGQGHRRSEVIFNALTQEGLLPTKGDLLDLGCGNGAFLRAAGSALQGWRLFGSEWDDKYLPDVQTIPGFEKLHTGDWNLISGQYDVISMVHVLEHIAAPLPVLEMIRRKLTPEGLLVIQVPDCQVNSYMLLIADHCSHFSVNTVRGLVEAAGFEVVVATNQWVQKEVTVVARAGGHPRPGRVKLPEADASDILAGLEVLREVLEKANALAQNASKFGIFGTSIAATWLASHLGDKVSFLVDEDPSRAAGTHMGRPILPPAAVQEGADIFVALPQPLASQVCQRSSRPGVRYLAP
jgi:SAM-dependent methyltransferase